MRKKTRRSSRWPIHSKWPVLRSEQEGHVSVVRSKLSVAQSEEEQELVDVQLEDVRADEAFQLPVVEEELRCPTSSSRPSFSSI